MKISKFDKNILIQKLNITKEEQNSIDWKNLENIFYTYKESTEKLNNIAKSFFYSVHDYEKVHLINYRIKDVYSVLGKIIRKEKKKISITNNNFTEQITDLIGIRIIHIFKEDWLDIHNFMKEKENSNFFKFFKKPEFKYLIGEDPRYFYGDIDERILEKLDEEIEFQELDTGYRSLHYFINFQNFNIEVQVRSIFEEAWGEIDHVIRYPNNTDDKITSNFSLILSKIAGALDQYSSNFKYYIDLFEKNKKELIDIENEKNRLIDNYSKKNNSNQKEIEKLKDQLSLSKNISMLLGANALLNLFKKD